jgi:hypothetical protein
VTKVAGYNGFLKRNTTGSTYATVGQIMSLSAVGSERALIDVSAHGDSWSDFVMGRQEGTEVELTIAFDPADAQHVALKTDYDAVTPASRLYELQHPAFATRALRFPAYTTQYEEEATDDGAYEAHVTFKIVSPGVTVVTPS